MLLRERSRAASAFLGRYRRSARNQTKRTDRPQGWSSTSATAPAASGPETGRTESEEDHVTIPHLLRRGSADAKQSAFLDESPRGRKSCAGTGRGRAQSGPTGGKSFPDRRKARRRTRRRRPSRRRAKPISSRPWWTTPPRAAKSRSRAWSRSTARMPKAETHPQERRRAAHLDRCEELPGCKGRGTAAPHGRQDARR